MNTSTSQLALVAIPVASFVAAAIPLLSARALRRYLLGVGGTSFLAIGAAAAGLTAGGFVSVAPAQAQELAAEKTEDAETANSKTSESKSAKAEADVEIDSPGETIVIPPGRPKWIGSSPSTNGKIHTIAVSSGPYATNMQSLRALDEALVKATNEYIAEQLGNERAPLLIHYDARAIRERFVNPEKKPENLYHDKVQYSVGWMHENFALLEFGPEFRNQIDRRWTKVRATSRLAQTGLVSGAALLLLASVFGYFRLDTVTRGYYTGRLQFMTAAAILSVVGAGAVLSQWIHWL